MKNSIKIIFSLISLVVITNCKEKKQPENQEISPENIFVRNVMMYDTVSSKNRDAFVQNQINEAKASSDFETNPLYNYFTAVKYERAKNIDSAKFYYSKMNSEKYGKEIDFLKRQEDLYLTIPHGGFVSASLMQKLLDLTHQAEKSNSKFLYKNYDLLAKSYYQNDNPIMAAEYTNKSFQVHPFRNNSKVRQRFYDIAFLLAAVNNNLDEMIIQNNKAKELAIKNNDSLALARTSDNDAQIYALQKKNPEKSIESSKKHLEYLLKTDAEHHIAYNNLATSYARAGKWDEAIINFRKANELMYKKTKESQVPDYYDGLKEAFAAKGNYKEALIAADSARAIAVRSQKYIDIQTVEEIHEKYQSEKKDQNIENLMKENGLNEKIINQQRWIIFSTLLLFAGGFGIFFSRHRNRLLKDKNALLEADNKRLNTERKMLQTQLNPHFIFNAIANLQSLINIGEKDFASKYLSSFSKLLRSILEQSRKDFISLDEEIDTLKNYLELQKMRFSNIFDFEINVKEDIEREALLIPPMLIQPFIENSIEHGFRNIKYLGKLNIHFYKDESHLFIDIIDNGSGIEETSINRKNKKSLSRIILKERLTALFSNNEHPAHFEVIDNKNNGEEGVTVKIELPLVWD